MKDSCRRQRSSILPTAGLLAALAVATHEAAAQGCVAVRGAGSCAATPAGMTNLLDSKWLGAVSYRWLHSDRHFVGDVEQTQRHDIGNQVINDSHFIDLSLSYAFTPRYSATLALPFVRHDRSSWYEHTRTNRYDSQSGGLGDARLTFGAWVLDPTKLPKGNLQIGIGVKAPTGDFAATDTFTTVRGPVTGYVDQSIQPGDGGWGVMLEVNGYQSITDGLFAYGQGFYLSNPRDVNGTSTVSGTQRGNPYEQVTSVPDAYLVRGGLGYAIPRLHGVTVTLGARVEGVPVNDLIGGDNGFRRPGFSVGIEPGISWMPGRWTFALSAPVMVYANRQRSVADVRWTNDDPSRYRHGDAAFATFLITFSASRAF